MATFRWLGSKLPNIRCASFRDPLQGCLFARRVFRGMRRLDGPEPTCSIRVKAFHDLGDMKDLVSCGQLWSPLDLCRL